MKNPINSILLLCTILLGLNLSAQGSNCASATEAVPGLNSADGPSAGAGAVLPDCIGDGSIGTNADWYTYTAPGNASVTIESCLQGVDTRVSIFTGTCTGLTCITGSDDFCEIEPGGDTWASSVTFAASAGTTYFIQWDDRWDADGFDWTLTENLLDCTILGANIGDVCDLVGTGDGIVSDDCSCVALDVPACATLLTPADGAVDVAIDPINDGVGLSWSLNGFQPNDGINIYWGTDPLDLFLIGAVGPESFNVNITSVTPGTYYWQAIPFNAIGEATGCVMFTFSTVGADTGEVPHCPTLLSPINNAVDVELNENSSVDLNWSNSPTGPVATINEIHFGLSPSELIFLGSTITDVTSVTIINLEEGLTYYWSIAPQNFSGTTDNCDVFSFTVAGLVDCPTLGPNGLNFGSDCDDGDPNTYNDVVADDACICQGILLPTNQTCLSALPISEGVYLNNKIISGGGASDFCFNGGLVTHALWHSYTATCNGDITITSSIDLDQPDTRLSVYTGACDAAICVASNDDINIDNFSSSVTFPGTVGTTYLIEWDDRWGNDAFDFEVSNVVNPTCHDEDKTKLEQVWTALGSPFLDGWNFSSCFELNDSWEGITMTVDGCNIKEIDLSLKGLTGNLSPVLGSFSELSDLDLSNNFLVGSIPSELGNTSQLEDLRLNNNVLSGHLPIELGDLGLLVTLSLNNNQLEGCIPSSFQSFCPGTTVDLTSNPLLANDDFDEFCASDIGLCPSICASDFDGNGVTDGLDFQIFLGHFGLICDEAPCQTDLNADGVTNGDDFRIFQGNYGMVCE